MFAATPPASAERLALAGAWLLVLAPPVAHGVWRPLVGEGGDAVLTTCAALAVAAAGVVGRGVRPGSSWVGGGSALATGLVAALAIGGPPSEVLATLGAMAAVVGLVVGVLPRLVGAVPPEVDGFALRRRLLAALVAIAALAAVSQTARVSSFIGDDERSDLHALPFLPELARHACLTAYVQASMLAEEGVDNLYDAEWWPDLSHSARSAEEARRYAPFGLDAYAYPPPFLLVGSALNAVSGRFADQRAIWFGLQALVVGLGLWGCAAWVGERAGGGAGRLLVFSFLLWLAPMVILTLQVGNVHIAMTVLAVLAMIALDQRQRALGAAVLSFVILAKISPGLLGVMLLVQRRWWDALATAAFGAAWTVLVYSVYGPAPFVAFVQYQLPRLRSGEALAFFTKSNLEIGMNMAPFGIPHKLQALGLPFEDVWATASTVGSAFTVVAVVCAVGAGLVRTDDRRLKLGLWLAVLTLAALNSPYAPGYAMFSALWMTMAWPGRSPKRDVVVILSAYVVLQCMFPATDRAVLLVSLVQQALLLGLALGGIVLAFPRSRQLALAAAGGAPSSSVG